MTRKEQFFAAFSALEKQGIKLRDITREQICRQMYVIGIDSRIFYQYRYVYRKEKGL